jgi:hypothetical protein
MPNAPRGDLLDQLHQFRYLIGTERLGSAGEALVAQFLLRGIALMQVVEVHASQHACSFRELDLTVVDDLHVVAPGIVEVKRSRYLHLDAGQAHRASDGFLVIHDQAKVARTVGRLRTVARQRDELIADVDESHPPSDATAQLEIEEPSVPVQRLTEIPHLQRYMVDSDEPRHVG